MTTLSITRRPIRLETGASAAMLTDILARIARIRGRASQWGVINDVTRAELLAGQSIEAEFRSDYYREGFVEGGAPAFLPGWTFSRTGAATAAAGSGTVEHFATGVPRITDRGLLIHSAATNILLRSEAFDHATWSKLNGGTGSPPVVTASAVTAPDGSLTADRIVFNRGASDTSSDTSMLFQGSLAVTAGSPYTASIWLKAPAPCTIVLRHVALSAFTLLNVTTQWQRFNVTETAFGTGGEYQFGLFGGQGASQSATVDAWGGQLTAGAAPTAYIPTTSATATTSADIALTSILAGDEGTIIAEVYRPAALAQPQVVAGAGNDVPVYFNNGVLVSLVGDSALSHGTAVGAAGGVSRVALTWKPGRRALTHSGLPPVTDSANWSPVSPLSIGSYDGGADGHLNSAIRDLVYIPYTLTDAELQSATA